MIGRRVVTRYGGTCATCQREIAEGEHVYWRRGVPGESRTEIHCLDDECGHKAESRDRLGEASIREVRGGPRRRRRPANGGDQA